MFSSDTLERYSIYACRFSYACAEIAKCAQRWLNMRRDSSFCAKSVRYNIFTKGAPYVYVPRFVGRLFVVWDLYIVGRSDLLCSRFRGLLSRHEMSKWLIVTWSFMWLKKFSDQPVIQRSALVRPTLHKLSSWRVGKYQRRARAVAVRWRLRDAGARLAVGVRQGPMLLFDVWCPSNDVCR